FVLSLAWMRFKLLGWFGLVGFTSTVTRDNLGTATRRSSRYLLMTSTLMLDRPVMFRPGRERLLTNPLPTGSAVLTMTMGMEVVACWAARMADAAATMTSTFICTNSADKPGRRSIFPSATRYSLI